MLVGDRDIGSFFNWTNRIALVSRFFDQSNSYVKKTFDRNSKLDTRKAPVIFAPAGVIRGGILPNKVKLNIFLVSELFDQNMTTR